MTNAHATMKLLTVRTKVEKKNIIIYMNKQTYYNSFTIKTILLIIKIKKTADNKRTFVQFDKLNSVWTEASRNSRTLSLQERPVDLCIVKSEDAGLYILK